MNETPNDELTGTADDQAWAGYTAEELKAAADNVLKYMRALSPQPAQGARCKECGASGPFVDCVSRALENCLVHQPAQGDDLKYRCRRCGKPCKVEVVWGHYHDQGKERVSACCRDLIDEVKE